MATARAFIEHCDEVRVNDIVPERRTHDLGSTLDCDLIMVCLPTPQREGSLECDTSAIDDFFRICQNGRASLNNFVLRSTVPIGTTRRLREQYGLPNLVHSPEFLTARCALVDAQMPARNIIGYPGATDHLPALYELYRRRWPHVPIHQLSSDESELVKLAVNSFFAVKVAYWNECHALASKLDLDWRRIMNAILADGRIGPSHTQVPGPDGKFGYGGTCLPKDLANLVTCLRENKLNAAVTEAAGLRNIGDRNRKL